MFLWNMLGALIGVPALSYFLLWDPKQVVAKTKAEAPHTNGEHSAPQESVVAKPLSADAR
ncbi:hypothetical protein D3C78_1723940 [compost metagenome]